MAERNFRVLSVYCVVHLDLTGSFHPRSQQRCQSPPAEPDDRRQPGRGLRPNSAPPTGGDGGCHHGYQVPEHCGGDPDRAPRAGKRAVGVWIHVTA